MNTAEIWLVDDDASIRFVLSEALPVSRVSVVASADRVFAAVMPVATRLRLPLGAVRVPHW